MLKKWQQEVCVLLPSVNLFGTSWLVDSQCVGKMSQNSFTSENFCTVVVRHCELQRSKPFIKYMQHDSYFSSSKVSGDCLTGLVTVYFDSSWRAVQRVVRLLYLESYVVSVPSPWSLLTVWWSTVENQPFTMWILPSDMSTSDRVCAHFMLFTEDGIKQSA